MDSLASDPTWATRNSTAQLVEKTGTQGVEPVMWLAARGTIKGAVRKVTGNYHVPISNTASGLLALETA